MFQGTIVAIVTPFKNGKVDEEGLRSLIEDQIAHGIDGIVPCGTTGESATLSHEEHEKVIEITIDAVKKRVPVIAGTGSNSTAEALRLTKHAYEVGADGVLMVCPYYNRPTQDGLFEHFKKIAESVSIPIILYNIPSRTGINLLPETVYKLSKLPNIVGIKEASGSLKQVMDIVQACGSNFAVLSGDDVMTLPMLAVGGKGVISVIANIVPQDMSDMIKNYLSGKVEVARELHYKMLPLIDALFLETNPVPVKTALHLMGKISYEVRLPLCRMTEANFLKLKKTLIDYGLVKG